jgi:hypothetical protein
MGFGVSCALWDTPPDDHPNGKTILPVYENLSSARAVPATAKNNAGRDSAFIDLTVFSPFLLHRSPLKRNGPAGSISIRRAASETKGNSGATQLPQAIGKQGGQTG